MTRAKVFVTRRIPEVGLEILRSGAEVRMHTGQLPPTRQELLEGVRGCAGILSLLSDRIDDEVFDAAGGELRVVSNFAVGYNNIDVEAARKRKILVGNTPDVLTEATADITLALLLAVARRLKEGLQAVEQGAWKTWEPMGWIGLDLRDKTLGIIGMGRIGEAVARRLHGGWNMRVLYTARSAKESVDRQLAAQHVGLDELLESSDVVSVHVPLCAETTHLLGRREFELMKPAAILINTARGEVIDQAALVAALTDASIFGAGLDVCTPEPLPVAHPLLQLPNCLVVPHIGSATVSARNAMAERAARNVIAGIAGEPLPFPVL